MSNLQSQVSVGQEVVTRDGETIGKVKEIGSTTFDIQHGVFVDHQYAIPYGAITSATKEKLTLSVGKDEIATLKKDSHIGMTTSERVEGVVQHAKDAVKDAVDAVKPRHGDKA